MQSANANQPQQMRSTLNHLAQLQELILVRDEQRSLRGSCADLSSFNASIAELTASLEPDAKTLFQRLCKSDHVVIAQIHDSSCSMCKLRLATSQVQAVKLCRALVCCPGCARVLCEPAEDAPQLISGGKARAAEPHKTGVARFSSPDLMLPDLRGGTAEEVIAEFCAALKNAGFIDEPGRLARQAVARENMMGTGVGSGLAFPHVRGVEGGGLSLAFGVSRRGVDFGGGDGGPSRFIFFSTIPLAVSVFYIRLMAGLSETFTKDANREAALSAPDPKELWKCLVKATRMTVK